MKKCEVCGKRAEGLGTYPVEFQGVILCANCYEGLKVFKNGRKFASFEEVRDKAILAHDEMLQKGFPPHVIEAVDTWFQQYIRKAEAVKKVKAMEQNLDEFMMTTGHTFEGYRIIKYHGVISGESVLGTGFLSSWDASWSDTFGVESEAFINKLKEARYAAKKRAVLAALGVGGNAIIGVDMEYTMFSGNLIGAIYNGTSVTIEKIEE